MPPDPYDARQAAQPVNDNHAAQPALPAANDYPAAEVQAVPGARARLAAARAQFDDAQSALHLLIDRLKEDFEYSADLSAAMRAEKNAYDRYTAARDRVLKQVAADSEYRTLRNLCKDLNDRLFNLKANPTANKSEIIATAELKLAYATKVSDMESDALKADSPTQDAKSRLIDAAAKTADLRAQFQRSLHRDKTVLAARREMQDAKVARVAASAMLDGALEARDIALDYAYWLHRRDPYTYRYIGNSYLDDLYGGYGFGSSLVYNPIYRPVPWR